LKRLAPRQTTAAGSGDLELARSFIFISWAARFLLCEPTMFRDPSFGFCLGIKLAEVTGGVAQPSGGSHGPRHLDAPMISVLYWPQYNTAPVHEFENMRVGRLGGKCGGGKR
jgi:hypothetical protein